MPEKQIDLSLSHLASGAIQEKLDGELKKVFDNIHDANTDPKDKRTITIKLEFKPDENREVISLSSDFTTKLAKVEGVATTLITGRDINTGFIGARELMSGLKGQTYMDVDEGVVKTDVGEPVDAIEQEKSSQVIDLQRKRG